MQPILAESAPHRGRAVVFAGLLAAVAAVSLSIAGHHRPRHRPHHQLHMQLCKRAHASYVLITR